MDDHSCCEEAGFVSARGGLETVLFLSWTSVGSWLDQPVVFLHELIRSVNVSICWPDQHGRSEFVAQNRLRRLNNQQGSFRENDELGLASIHIFLPSDWGQPAL